MMPNGHADFVRLLDITLPNGGHALAMIEAYFDESESHTGKPFFCVAGYTFEQAQAVKFDGEWRRMLDDFDLPYFHMTACEARAEPFTHLEFEVRTAIQTRAVRIIKESICYGVVVSVDPEAWHKIMPPHPLTPRTPYSFCVHGSFVAIKQRADAENYHGKIAYFFEAGQEHQEETDRLMRQYMDVPDSMEIFRYQSHTFIRKKDSTLLQAADLLAWHCANNYQRVCRGGYSRDDFVNLAKDDRIYNWHFNEAALEEQADIIKRVAAANPDAGKA
jgi:hypothetical protein